jgi:hypothetical protein
MTRKGTQVLTVGLVVIALTALLLGRLQALQKLGTPGVRIVPGIVLGDGGKIVGTNTVDLPRHVLNYDSEAVPQPDTVIDWLPRDTTLGQRVYTASNSPWFQLTAVVMGTDRTSIHKPEYCLEGQGFTIDRAERDTVLIEKPHRYELPVMRFTCSRAGTAKDGSRELQRALYVFWFVSEDQLTADHNERMKWMARDLILHQTLKRWAYVSCFGVCKPGQEDLLYAKMQDFIGAAVPQFQVATGPGPVPEGSR